MPNLQFVKAQGAGNDFVILDEAGVEVKQLPTLIPKLCDRHFGIGADGVLLVSFLGIEDKVARGRVVFYNVDASRAEMCGNGLRCAALYLEDKNLDAHHLGENNEAPKLLLMQTDVGVRRCEFLHKSKTGPKQLRVEMGHIEVHPSEVDNALLSKGIKTNALQAVAVAASAGNPHLVVLAAADEDILRLEGPDLSRHSAFANGCNVEWVQALGDHRYRVEVFERGVGRTLACGSGACAVAAVLIAQGLEKPDQKITIEMPGGRLDIEWDPTGQALLSGPAQLVFSGQISI